VKGWNRIHAYGQCYDCDWNYGDEFGEKKTHLVGQKCKEHAERTGHRVHAEIGFSKWWN